MPAQPDILSILLMLLLVLLPPLVVWGLLVWRKRRVILLSIFVLISVEAFLVAVWSQTRR